MSYIPEVIEKKLLVVDDKRVDFAEHAECLEGAGIPHERYPSIDELLDDLRGMKPNDLLGFSLDLRMPTPNWAETAGAAGELGGRWLCQEVLKNSETSHLGEDKRRINEIVRKEVGFLTNYAEGDDMSQLKSEMSSIGYDLSIFDKKSTPVESYLEWVEALIDQEYLYEEYQSASLTACRLLQKFDVTSSELISALGAHSKSYRLREADKDRDVWRLLMRIYPPEKCIGVEDAISRWNTTSAILAETLAAFDHDLTAAKADLTSGIQLFDGLSAMQVLTSGDAEGLAKLDTFVRYRWGRN